jgi:hypothetical protein
LKVLQEDIGFSKHEIDTKCTSVGGFVLSPMNEQYTNDIEDLISSTELKVTDFWLGMYAQCSFF